MESSAVDHDRLFNLQLTIQRLEEELSLYRNGTTCEQMFDLMKEKEAEIAELKVVIADKDSKLRKLAKSSTEFITKFEDLQMTHRGTLLELAEMKRCKEEDMKNHILITNELNDKCDILGRDLESQRQECLRLASVVEEKVNCATELATQLSARDATIAQLAGQAREADQSIQKLQARCVELVNDKTQKFRLLDAERQEMISKVQSYKESMAAFLSERDQVIVMKNERIQELKKQLRHSQGETKSLEESVAAAQAERDAKLEQQQTQLAAAQAECAEAQHRAAQLEAQSKSWMEEKAQHEATRAKLALATERLGKFEQAQKRRVLQDTTNTTGSANNVNMAVSGAGAADGGLLDKGSVKNAIRALAGTKQH